VSEDPNRETHTEETPESLAGRLRRLEKDLILENRWWRGGLIAALVLLAFSVLFGGLHRPSPPPAWGIAPMGMGSGWGGPPPNMPGAQFMPPPPPLASGAPWNGPGGCGSYEGGGRPAPWGGHGSGADAPRVPDGG
jgi:hypothetical protein